MSNLIRQTKAFYCPSLGKHHYHDNEIFAASDLQFKKMLRKANAQKVFQSAMPTNPQGGIDVSKLYASVEKQVVNQYKMKVEEAKQEHFTQNISPTSINTSVVNIPAAKSPIFAAEAATPVHAAPVAEVIAPVYEAPIVETPAPAAEAATPVCEAPVAEAPIYRTPTPSIVEAPAQSTYDVEDQSSFYEAPTQFKVVTSTLKPAASGLEKALSPKDVKSLKKKEKANAKLNLKLQKAEEKAERKADKRKKGITSEEIIETPKKKTSHKTIKRLGKKQSAPTEEELELERINNLINKDGYYDTLLPPDHGYAVQKINRGFIIKIVLLVIALIVIIIGTVLYFYYLI